MGTVCSRCRARSGSGPRRRSARRGGRRVPRVGAGRRRTSPCACTAATTSSPPSATASSPASSSPMPGDDYRFVLDGGDALPGPVLALAAARASRAVADRRHVARFEIAPGPDAARSTSSSSTSCTSGRSRARARSTAAIPRLAGLRELGVTAIELMPVATFPGNRGWGYDGALHLRAAPGLRRPARARAARRRRAPRGPRRDPRRRLQPHRPGLGGDRPRSARTSPTATRRFWGDGDRLLAARRARVGDPERASCGRATTGSTGCGSTRCTRSSTTRRAHVLRRARPRARRPGALVISEMGVGDFRPLEEWGHDAQWADNLHHELHVLLTGERDGLLRGVRLARTGLVARARVGAAPERLVVCAQNHDQVGNRALGDRLPPDAHARRARASCSSRPPRRSLFMGEEHGEDARRSSSSPTTSTRRSPRRRARAASASSPRSRPSPARRCPTRRRGDVRALEASRTREPDPFYAELLALRRELPRELERRAVDGRAPARSAAATATLVADFAHQTVELRA